jgi:hypothetical protein
VPRAKLEDGFAEIIKTLQPAERLFDLAKAMLCDAWDMRLAAAGNEKSALQKQFTDVERQIGNLLDRVVDASSPSVVSAYETRIEKLEREKIVLAERVAKTVPPKGRLEDCIELALRFLANPWYIYENGDYVMRRTVLRLAFQTPLRYGKNGVYRTPEFSFPFKYLAETFSEKNEMVPVERIELPTFGLQNQSTTTLRKSKYLNAFNILFTFPLTPNLMPGSCFWSWLSPSLPMRGIGLIFARPSYRHELVEQSSLSSAQADPEAVPVFGASDRRPIATVPPVAAYARCRR